MTLKLNSSSGGSVSLNAPNTVSDYTLTLPTQTGTVATTNDIRAIDVQTFTSSGTWTKPSGYAAGSRVYVQAWGAGGSGGRNSTAANMGGGGGGGYTETWLTLSQFGATETITIGAGGASRTGSNQAGAVGGTTTVGSLVSAYGGGGGGIGTYNSNGVVNGGGGGGMLSAGNSGGTGSVYSTTSGGFPGLPLFHGSNIAGGPLDHYAATSFPQGAGAGKYYIATNTLCTTDFYAYSVAVDAFMTGGGGGANLAGLSGELVGSKSVWGGGGGGGGATSGANGGTSLYGGNGGAAGTTGTAGTQPGGGGGGGTSTSGAGGDGKVIVTVFPA
jgi:hypothetical protein